MRPPPQQRKDEKGQDDDDDDITPCPCQFQVTCSSRDVILYALSIGFASQPDRYESDLKYVWEDHEAFTAVPTFFLSFPFWAAKNGNIHNRPSSSSSSSKSTTSTTGHIPPFPPPIMKLHGVLPDRFLRKGIPSISYESSSSSSSSYPIIHISQSIQWHDHGVLAAWRHNATPASSWSSSSPFTQTFGVSALEILSVVPKSMGTFVTSRTKVYQQPPPADDTNNHNSLSSKSPSCCCTMQMTMLILGISMNHVIPFPPESSSSSSLSLPRSRKQESKINYTQQHQQLKVVHEEEFVVAMNQALLFRLASGDSNKIHVDPTASSLEPDDDSDNDDDEDDDDDKGSTDQKKKKQSSTTRRHATLLMHGLGTLGLTVRIILQFLSSSLTIPATLDYLHTEFVKPVFLNDKLTVRLSWARDENDEPEIANIKNNSTSRVLVYQVRNAQTNQLVLSGHVRVLVQTAPDHVSPLTNSRL
jgi:acyl dehydratase